MRSYFTLVMLLHVTLAFPQPLLAAPVIVQTEVNPNNGLTYHLLSPSNWTDAEAKAVDLGGTLATLRSASENDWVWATFRGATDQSRYLWVGLHRTSQWVWASSEPVTYTNWALGEPSGAPDFSAEPYVQMGYHGNPIPSAWNNLANMSEWLGTPLMGVVETAVVPEPSTCFSLAAGLVFGGWHVLKRRRRRTAAVISRSVVALLVVTCCATTFPTYAVNYEMVTVGDAGNPPDTTGYGAVPYEYRIGKYEVTNAQYTAFLNAVATTDAYSLYHSGMGTDARGGIARIGASGGYAYEVKPSMGSKPVNYVSWFDAARMANWLQNGQGSGGTETGAYTLVGGQTSGTAPACNVGAHFFVPTEDQWFKAAYFNGSTSAYSSYSTNANITPSAVTANETGDGSAGNSGNFANYDHGASWNGQSGNVTTVGTNGGPSFYGAFDMTGNLWELNDLAGGPGVLRGRRGGVWHDTASFLLSSTRLFAPTNQEGDGDGFRLAAPVPEPSALALCAGAIALVAMARGAYP